MADSEAREATKACVSDSSKLKANFDSLTPREQEIMDQQSAQSRRPKAADGFAFPHPFLMTQFVAVSTTAGFCRRPYVCTTRVERRK